MNDITTTDFAKFGPRERHMAIELLEASVKQGFPEEFIEEEITIMLNFNSGYVFFANIKCQVAMLNGDNLEIFYSCPGCGNEGFAEEMKECFDNHF